MGLIIDVIIAYIVKSLLRMYWWCRSGEWHRITAKIESANVGGGWVANCPTVELEYTYEFNGETYREMDRKPFFLETSARIDMERFLPGSAAVVRVNPLQPQTSFLSRADQ